MGGGIEFSNVKYEANFKYSMKWKDMLYFAKKAKSLHKEYKTRKDDISMRLCSILINNKIDLIKNLVFEQTLTKPI